MSQTTTHINTNAMSNSNTLTPATALPLEFGGFTIPAACRRIFITAELKPSDGEFVTATTIDGHRFASEYVMGAQFAELSDAMKKAFEEQAAAAKAKEDEEAKKPAAKKAAKKSTTPKSEFVLWVRHLLGMTTK